MFFKKLCYNKISPPLLAKHKNISQMHLYLLRGLFITLSIHS